VTCNISLGRRRDLTLRTDIVVHGSGGPMSLGDLFRGRRTVVLGLPGGKVCEEQHMPDYLRNFGKLQALGVDKVVVVKQKDPEAVKDWAARMGVDASVMEAVADPQGHFTRLLGVEILGAEGPRNHRYTALVDSGILLKIAVEEQPKDYAKCSVDTTTAAIRTLIHQK